MEFGHRPIDAKIYKIEWEEVERTSNRQVIYTTEEGQLLGRKIVKKTMQTRRRDGTLNHNIREWFIFDGSYWNTAAALSSYLINLNKDEKERQINTKYR